MEWGACRLAEETGWGLPKGRWGGDSGLSLDPPPYSILGTGGLLTPLATSQLVVALREKPDGHPIPPPSPVPLHRDSSLPAQGGAAPSDSAVERMCM